MDFQGVIKILDEAIGGPGVGIGAHRAFWRDITRDEFVVKKVFGKAVVVLGDGANSNLVRALKGESPFGSDLPNPPEGATVRRMPAGRPPAGARGVDRGDRALDQRRMPGRIGAAIAFVLFLYEGNRGRWGREDGRP